MLSEKVLEEVGDIKEEKQFIILTKIQLSTIEERRLTALLRPQVRRYLNEVGEMELLLALVRSDDGVECFIHIEQRSVDNLAEYLIAKGDKKVVIFLGSVPRIYD